MSASPSRPSRRPRPRSNRRCRRTRPRRSSCPGRRGRLRERVVGLEAVVVAERRRRAVPGRLEARHGSRDAALEIAVAGALTGCCGPRGAGRAGRARRAGRAPACRAGSTTSGALVASAVGIALTSAQRRIAHRRAVLGNAIARVDHTRVVAVDRVAGTRADREQRTVRIRARPCPCPASRRILSRPRIPSTSPSVASHLHSKWRVCGLASGRAVRLREVPTEPDADVRSIRRGRGARPRRPRRRRARAPSRS